MALVFNGNTANYLQKSITFTASKGAICGWVRLTSDPNVTQAIFQMRADDSAQVGLYTQSDGTTISTYLGASDTSATGSSLSTNTWYHLAVTWNGTSLITYVNGVANITHTNTGSTWNEIRLGFDVSYWGDSFVGNMADVMAWDDTLTAAQILQQMYRKVPVTFANLKLWLPTFDGSGERNRDYSGQGNTLTVTGTITDTANPPISWGARPWVVPFVVDSGTPVTVALAADVIAVAQPAVTVVAQQAATVALAADVVAVAQPAMTVDARQTITVALSADVVDITQPAAAVDARQAAVVALPADTVGVAQPAAAVDAQQIVTVALPADIVAVAQPAASKWRRFMVWLLGACMVTL